MKILRAFVAVLVLLVMIPVLFAGIIVFIVSIELQPDNLNTLVSDVVSVTLSKENLTRITVADVEQYLPAELKKDLPSEATLYDVVPIAFDNITGLDSYISQQSVERMIDDDVVRDVTMAVLNEEDYDLVGLVDKYDIKLDAEQRTLLTQVKTSTVKQELAGQGYDVDEIVTEQIESGAAPVASSTSGSATSWIDQTLKVLNPVLIAVSLVATLGVFYLLLSLVWWDFKNGLIYWGAGVVLVGVILLALNFSKLQLIEIGVVATGTDINMTILTPAIERLARPIIWAGVLSLICGGGAMVGGSFWRKKHQEKAKK